MVYHNPLQHLGGPGGHTIYTFDFLTVTWAKVHVSGFESASLRAIGTHHGQVGAPGSPQRAGMAAALCGTQHLYHDDCSRWSTT